MTAKTDLAIAQADPAARIEVIAAAAGLAVYTIRTMQAAGSFPPSDSIQIRPFKSAYAWKISTLRAWNPVVADRCLAVLEALEKAPTETA